MRLVRFLIFFLLINAIVTFCVLLNLKLAFGTEDKLKSTIRKSDAYEVVTAAIRENVVAVNPELDEGGLLEVLNDKIDPKVLQVLTEDMIDQIYALQNNKSGQKEIILRYSLLKDQLPGIALPPDKPYPLDNGQFPVLPFLGNFYAYLGGAALMIVLLLILHIKFIGETKKQKIKWLGFNFALIFVELIWITLILYYFVPGAMNQLLDAAQLENQKISRGMTKVIESILSEQQLFYIMECGAAFVTAFFMMLISKAIKDNPTRIEGPNY